MVWKQIQAEKHHREKEKDAVKFKSHNSGNWKNISFQACGCEFLVFEEGRLNQHVLSVWLLQTGGMLSLKLSSVSISDVSISDTLNKAEEEMCFWRGKNPSDFLTILSHAILFRLIALKSWFSRLSKECFSKVLLPKHILIDSVNY